jgi:polar amino acid transport system substrate-binding protein
MKSAILSILAISALLSMTATASDAIQKTLVLAGSDYCPYVCLDNQGNLSKNPGIHIEILQSLMEPHGIAIQNISMPWIRAVAETSKGNIDALNGAFSEDAPLLLFPEQAISTSTMCFYTSNESKWTYKDLASLKQVTVLKVQGISINKEIDNYLAHPKSRTLSISYENYYAAYDKFLSRDIHTVFIEDQYVANHLMTNYWQEDFREAGCIEENDMWIPFNPNKQSSQDYIQIINENLEAFKASKKWQAIAEKYLPKKLISTN